MEHGSDGSRGLVTVHLCTIHGVAVRFHRVEMWTWYSGQLNMLRDGRWETVTLERRHVGAYATGGPPKPQPVVAETDNGRVPPHSKRGSRYGTATL